MTLLWSATEKYRHTQSQSGNDEEARGVSVQLIVGEGG